MRVCAQAVSTHSDSKIHYAEFFLVVVVVSCSPCLLENYGMCAVGRRDGINMCVCASVCLFPQLYRTQKLECVELELQLCTHVYTQIRTPIAAI